MNMLMPKTFEPKICTSHLCDCDLLWHINELFLTYILCKLITKIHCPCWYNEIINCIHSSPYCIFSRYSIIYLMHFLGLRPFDYYAKMYNKKKQSMYCKTNYNVNKDYILRCFEFKPYLYDNTQKLIIRIDRIL